MSNSHVSAIVKLFEKCRYKHDIYTVFSDWCQCAAISLSNAVDLPKRDEREKQYLEVVRRYDPATLKVFPEILGAVVMALEEKPTDILGQVFHALELHNTARGQFFTPYSICEMMAKINIGSGDDVAAVMKGRGYIRAQEPACGSGAMVIALAEAMKDAGHSYQQCLHVTAIDIDRRAVHMAYIQFALLHIPAVILEGNTLSLEFRDEWKTPAHILDQWNAKFRLWDQIDKMKELCSSVPAPVSLASVKTNDLPTQDYAVEKTGQIRLF
jgi:type I restriction-modification system DNA methylase subunit